MSHAHTHTLVFFFSLWLKQIVIWYPFSYQWFVRFGFWYFLSVSQNSKVNCIASGYIQRIETGWVEIHYPPIVSTGFESRQNVQRYSIHKKCTQTFASSFMKLSSLLVTWHRLSIVYIPRVYVWMFMLSQDSNERRSIWASNIICFFRIHCFSLARHCNVSHARCMARMRQSLSCWKTWVWLAYAYAYANANNQH